MVLSKPEMGILKPGMDPFSPGMGPVGPMMDPFSSEMGPFRPGTGLLRLKKNDFFLFDFFFFFDNSGPFEKIVGQIRLIFDFGWGVH